MKNLKNVLVALDLTEMDENLLKVAGFFYRNPSVEQVTFAHIIPSLVLPEGIQDIIHGLGAPGFQLNEMVSEKIDAEVRAKWSGILHKEKPFGVRVEEGKPFKNLLNLLKQTEANLLLVGKKKSGSSGGIVSKMVARNAECAVCFVTENPSLAFKNVLVPMDFSRYSIRAIQMAKELTAGIPGAIITALHVLDYPPTSQYLTGKYGLLVTDWESKLENLFSKMLKKHKIDSEGIEFVGLKNEYFDTTAHIREFATAHKADFILMGAKGHHAFDDLFLGSVTEKLVTVIDEIPVLVVR